MLVSLPRTLLDYSPDKRQQQRFWREHPDPSPPTLPECASLCLTSPFSSNSFPASPTVSSFSLPHGGHQRSLRTHQTNPHLANHLRVTDVQTSPFHVSYMWLPLASAGTSGGSCRLSGRKSGDSLRGRVSLTLLTSLSQHYWVELRNPKANTSGLHYRSPGLVSLKTSHSTYTQPRKQLTWLLL